MNPALFDSDVADLFNIRTRVPGPRGSLPFTEEQLRERPSGDLFGWSQNVGMGWNPEALRGDEFLLLSTHGGIRAPDGSPIALGYHTGHWEVGLLLEGAAHVLRDAGAIPFAASCTDPCDGRSQGTSAMFDSLPFRNDAATVFRRLIRSLPTRRGVLGVATCDKGLPAMMMALAATRDLPCVLVPGGSLFFLKPARMRAQHRRSACDSCMGKSRSSRRQRLGVAPVEHREVVVSFSVPRPHHRSLARHSGSRWGIRRWRRRVIPFGLMWRTARRARC
jgi:dihydroxyacid dehydratase/phosphogluconate dehydratase